MPPHRKAVKRCTPLVDNPIMQEKSYPVYLNLKIPLLARTFYYLFWACLIVLFIFLIRMIPSKYSSNEMKTAYFILTTSEFEKRLLVFTAIGTPAFFILYLASRYRRRAMLTLSSDKIELDDYKLVTSYSISDITHIFCNDAMRHDGYPKGKLTIDFKDKEDKVNSMTLIDYGQSDELMETLMSYENIRFSVSSFASNPEMLDA